MFQNNKQNKKYKKIYIKVLYGFYKRKKLNKNYKIYKKIKIINIK